MMCEAPRIDVQPGLAAQVLARQARNGAGQAAAEVPQNEEADAQQSGRSKVLAAHNLALFAGLLAAIGRGFVCLIAKIFGSHRLGAKVETEKRQPVRRTLAT